MQDKIMTVKKHIAQQGFCVRRAEVQNSTVVFQINISNKTSFSASKSRPNAKPQTVVYNVFSELTQMFFFYIISHHVFLKL